MLKRVIVVDGTDEEYCALEEAASDSNAQVLRMSTGDAIPAGIVAAVSRGSDACAALEAALTIAGAAESLLDLLGEAVDCREGFFIGSTERVRSHAVRFSEALDLGPDERSILERGALVRDIGKTKIPNEVLLKDTALTYDEWILLQQHPEIGADIVERIPLLEDTADVVRYHHECYDGDGYPRGLEGDQIPLLARVMKIIDVYCAMTSPRHYREGLSTHEQSIEYLRSEKGKHYDPDLLEVFIDKNVGRNDTESESVSP